MAGSVDYPLGTHPDEWVKVDSVLSGASEHYHPVLMLQLARAANAVMGLVDSQRIVELGRECAVIAAGAMVYATFILGREVLAPAPALAAAASVAVIPLTTVHARYFKEDIFLAPLLVIALIALIRMLKFPSPARGAVLGTAIGLAAAAKYVAALTLPFSVAVLLLDPSVASRTHVKAAFATIVCFFAVAVFTLVELPALYDMTRMQSGILFSYNRAIEGPDIRLPISVTHGFFHLRESLLPGLGLPLAFLGCLGMAVPFFASSELRRPLWVITAFALMWYAVHEVSPLKPFPDVSRYMVPIAPLLIILGAAFVRELMRGAAERTGDISAAAIVLIAAIPALSLSLQINGPARQDPRTLVRETLQDLKLRATFDRYAAFDGVNILGLTKLQPTPATTDLVVTANFTYDRFLRYGYLASQPKSTRAAAAYYSALFRLPCIEVDNGRKSFGFFNPAIKIVALDSADSLLRVAEAIRSTNLRLHDCE